jgi:hypothetical protein
MGIGGVLGVGVGLRVGRGVGVAVDTATISAGTVAVKVGCAVFWLVGAGNAVAGELVQPAAKINTPPQIATVVVMGIIVLRMVNLYN